MMDEEVLEKIDDVVKSITNSYEYRKCLELKIKMSQNKELNQLIQDIKTLQQKYIKEQKEQIKKELEEKQQKLEQIPIYDEYNNYLQQVNEKIEFVKDFLNDYFYQKLNDDIHEKH